MEDPWTARACAHNVLVCCDVSVRDPDAQLASFPLGHPRMCQPSVKRAWHAAIVAQLLLQLYMYIMLHAMPCCMIMQCIKLNSKDAQVAQKQSLRGQC